MVEFDQFYQMYPLKKARANAQMMWNRLTEQEKKEAIAALPNHIKYWDTNGTTKEFIPHAASWLNPKIGRRWEDEIEMPKPSAKITSAWWTSDDATIAEGNRRGMQARPGESMSGFRERLKVSA